MVAHTRPDCAGMWISSLRDLDWEHHWENKLDLHRDILLFQDL